MLLSVSKTIAKLLLIHFNNMLISNLRPSHFGQLLKSASKIGLKIIGIYSTIKLRIKYSYIAFHVMFRLRKAPMGIRY